MFGLRNKIREHQATLFDKANNRINNAGKKVSGHLNAYAQKIPRKKLKAIMLMLGFLCFLLYGWTIVGSIIHMKESPAIKETYKKEGHLIIPPKPQVLESFKRDSSAFQQYVDSLKLDSAAYINLIRKRPGLRDTLVEIGLIYHIRL